jgi:chitinase
MTKTSCTEKIWLSAVFLPLLCLGQARGQTVDGTQIVAYNDSGSVYNIENLDHSAFTTFNVGFLMPGGTPGSPDLTYDSEEQDSTAAGMQELSSNFVTGLNATEAAGKNVVLSFGGGDASSSAYSAFADTPADTATLASILTAYVTGAPTYTDANGVMHATYAGSTAFVGFNGIDLDYEDTTALTTGPGYDGTTFITNLTNDLRADLPAKDIITQAPQIPYLNTNYNANNGTRNSYQAIITNGPGGTITAAGTATTWLNVQIYNNPGFDGNTADGQKSVSGVVQAFETLVNQNPGIPTSKLVLTLPIHEDNANDNNTFTNAELTSIIQQINTFLASKGDGILAGVTGFELYSATYGNDPDSTYTTNDGINASFASTIQAADSVPEPSSIPLMAIGACGAVWLMRRGAVSKMR